LKKRLVVRPGVATVIYRSIMVLMALVAATDGWHLLQGSDVAMGYVAWSLVPLAALALKQRGSRVLAIIWGVVTVLRGFIGAKFAQKFYAGTHGQVEVAIGLFLLAAGLFALLAWKYLREEVVPPASQRET
jgi:hypothetical protein